MPTLPTYTKAIVGALLGALSFLAGAAHVGASWSDLGAPSVVIGFLLAAVAEYAAVWGIKNGPDSSPDTSTPEF